MDGNVRGQSVKATSIAFVVIAGFFMILRTITRLFVVKRFGWEDATICLAYASSIACVILVVREADLGLGLHFYEVPADLLAKQLYPLWGSMIAYTFVCYLVKISIIMQYQRIFIDIFTQLANVVAMTFSVSAMVAFSMACILTCTPPAYFWNGNYNGQCSDKFAIWIANSTVNAILDVVIILIPQPALWRLNLNRARKVGLMLLFAVGVFAIACCLARIYYTVDAMKTTDLTYSNVEVAKWGVIEINVSIICACLITIRPLFSRILPRVFATTDVASEVRVGGRARGHKNGETSESMAQQDSEMGITYSTYGAGQERSQRDDRRYLGAFGHVSEEEEVGGESEGWERYGFPLDGKRSLPKKWGSMGDLGARERSMSGSGITPETSSTSEVK